jgi:two-component system chemotaxis response regulator CheY
MNEAPILVVDDSSCFRLIAGEMLKEMGYANVTSATDGDQALQLLQNKPFSLVLSDYMMARFSGIDLLRSMKSDPKLEQIPFVLVSAQSEAGVIQEALELGAVSCILRPLAYNLFKKKVSAIIPL